MSGHTPRLELVNIYSWFLRVFPMFSRSCFLFHSPPVFFTLTTEYGQLIPDEGRTDMTLIVNCEPYPNDGDEL